MKLVMRFGAAMSLAALTACTQSGQDNAAENMDANMTAEEGVLPVTDNEVGTDTLGNQLNQLNEDANLSGNAAGNSSGDSTNSY